MKLQDRKFAGHENAGHENAGHEHDGPKMTPAHEIAGEKRYRFRDEQ